MEEELKQLKSVLRSLVVSSATQVDVRTLLRDYRTMVGKHLPYGKYGYKEPITFLKEHFIDCFLFQGPITNPVLTLIVPDSLKHIDKFVQKQKVNNVKLKGKRRSVLENTVKPVYKETNLIAKTFINRDTVIEGAPQFNNPKINLQKDKENVHTQSLLKPPSPVEKKKGLNDVIKDNGICSQNALENFLKKRTPLYNSSLSVSDKDSNREDGDSGRLSSSSTSSKRIQIEQLHTEIKEIIMENTDGVWCTDLLRLYRARYNRELNYSRLGYTSVLSVACALDGVHVSRRALADDWLLSDATRPLAARPAPRAARRPPPAPAPADPDDALPGIDFVRPRRRRGTRAIPSLRSPCLTRASVAGAGRVPRRLRALPGEHPRRVARGRVSGRHAGGGRGRGVFALSLLAAAAGGGVRHRHGGHDGRHERVLRTRRGDGSSAGPGRRAARPLLRQPLRRGLAPGDHRAGSRQRHGEGAARGLRHGGARGGRVAARPAEALRGAAGAGRAGAAGRRPPPRRRPALAARRLALLPGSRERQAPRGQRGGGPRARPRSRSAADRHDHGRGPLRGRRAGARRPRRPAPRLRRALRPSGGLQTAECHLYPRFEALESGATPSFAEVHSYLRDGIALDFVHDYRRHVPPRLPPDEPAPSPPPSESAGPPPSPPASAPDAPRTVSLAAADCETFAALSRVDACAAQRFMLAALRRARAAPVRPPPGFGGS